MRRALAATCLLLAAAAPASAATKLVVTGRGWGHGVGMSQWGAYGYASHGWTWQRILAHYYPGTVLGNAPTAKVRVLLLEHARRATVGCAGGIRVSDRTGRSYPLAAGTYGIGPKLLLPVGHKHVRLSHPRRARTALVSVSRALHAPVVFDCATAPLELNGRPYHGTLVVRPSAGTIAAVNTVPLDEYVRGVVAGEMPWRWSIAALAAQAVAARSYALATLKPTKTFDLYADTRSQMYGGIAFETPRTDVAVAKTAGKVLLWRGHVATTYFFSTSGGRTANVADVWPQLGDIPYLRSVPDPYDSRSPRHVWGPLQLDPARVAAQLHVPVGGVKVVGTPSGRARGVEIGSHWVTAAQFRQALGLASTWFQVGELSLTSSSPRLVFGQKVSLSLRAEGVGRATLERRVGAGAWRTLASVDGSRSVTVEPQGQTLYRLSSRGVAGPVVVVAVAPKLTVVPTGMTQLSGTVAPVVRGDVSVLRRVGDGWKVVAHPQVDPGGRFDTPLRLRPGAYRVVLAGDTRFSGTAASLTVTPRLLASLRAG